MCDYLYLCTRGYPLEQPFWPSRLCQQPLRSLLKQSENMHFDFHRLQTHGEPRYFNGVNVDVIFFFFNFNLLFHDE